MLTTQGFIARDLYNKGVLPTKYLNLVGIPEIEYKWVNYNTGATKKEGWVEPGSVYLLYKFVNGVRSDESLAPYTSNWTFVSALTTYTNGTLVALNLPPTKAQTELTWGAGIWNMNKSYHFFAQIIPYEDGYNNGWFAPGSGYAAGNFSTPTTMRFSASNQSINMTGRPQGAINLTLNNSSYPYQSSDSRPIVFNGSTREQCVSLDDIALKVGNEVIYKGSNVSI